jgi:hypothetical protein
MKTIFEHIEYAKEKPHHIRKRIAFAAAALGSTLVALVWLVGSFSLGSFAIQGSNFADSTTQTPVVTVPESDINPTSGLAGVAGALKDAKSPAHIEIVDTNASTSASPKAEQTTIPF